MGPPHPYPSAELEMQNWLVRRIANLDECRAREPWGALPPVTLTTSTTLETAVKQT
jgi:hypothetical protein